MKVGSREAPFWKRLQHPVDREKARRNGYTADVRVAHMETGSDFHSTLGSELVPEFEAPLQCRACSGKGGLILRDHSPRWFTGLVQAGLRPQAGVFTHRKALLETRLRLPQPQVPGRGQGRECDLRQRIRVALRDQGLVLTHHYAGVLPRSEERRVGKECRSRWSP